MIAQTLADGSISANWFFGLVMTALLGLIWYNLTQFRSDVKDVLKQHDKDINELKIHKADGKDVIDMRNANNQTIKELDKAISSLDKTMSTLSTKLSILNGD